MTTVVLVALAVLYAGPAPCALTRLPQLRRTPRSAMVLWQAVALAAVLAALGAGLSLATAPEDERLPALGYAVSPIALAVTALVLARLLLSGHRVGTDLRDLRRRHRRLLDLLAEDREGVRVLEHEALTAYCLPGLRSHVVVTSGAVAALSHEELDAVLAHERAHLRARHDLVLEAFTVLQRAFPAVVTSHQALEEVRLLVEVLADRVARRQHGSVALVRALSALVGSGSVPTPRGAVAATDTGLRARLELLVDDDAHPAQAGLTVLTAVAVLVLPTLLVVMPWLTGLRPG